MNRSHTIREYVTANPDQTCGEIADALGMTSKQVGVPLHEMARAGILLKEGPGNRYRYRIGRTELQKRYATEEERKAARRETNRRYEIRRTGKAPGERKPAMSREEHLSRRREQAKKARSDERAVKEAKRMAAPPKPAPEFRKRLHESVQSAMAIKAVATKAVDSLTKQMMSQIDPESVASFLSRGGTIELLPPGAGNSLKFLGVEL